MRFAPFLACLALATPAFASNPTSTYVHPSQVEFIPDQKNATQVVIHGAFFFFTMNGIYTSPTCGKMTFACKNGEEAMCRMQWDEIAAAIGTIFCEGFGQWNIAPTAKFYGENDPLGVPDIWDLGMGVQAGTFVDGKCDPAKALKCAAGGAPDAGAPADLSGGTPADLAGGGGSPDIFQGRDDFGASPDMTKLSTPNGGCGCAVGARTPALPGALALLALLGLTLRRRRAR